MGGRPPLCLVGCQQRRSAPAFEHPGKLPAEIGGFLEPGMHANAPGRRAFMRGITGNEDAIMELYAYRANQNSILIDIHIIVYPEVTGSEFASGN